VWIVTLARLAADRPLFVKLTNKGLHFRCRPFVMTKK
jgi:hypothetical protein